MMKGDLGFRVYLRSQKCWDIRQKAPDARRMSAALLGGMQANATRQMGLFGRIEQRWGVFRYTLAVARVIGDDPEKVVPVRDHQGDGQLSPVPAVPGPQGVLQGGRPAKVGPAPVRPHLVDRAAAQADGLQKAIQVQDPQFHHDSHLRCLVGCVPCGYHFSAMQPGKLAPILPIFSRILPSAAVLGGGAAHRLPEQLAEITAAAQAAGPPDPWGNTAFPWGVLYSRLPLSI